MFRIIFAILLLISSPAWAVTQWNKAIPAAGDSKSAWPGQATAQWSILDTLMANYRQGEKLVYKNATTLTISSGQVVVSNSGASLRIFLSDSGNTDITTANLDSGSSFSNSTTYYVYAAASSSTAASSTYYISLSSSAPTGPTYYSQLGNFTTTSGGAIANIIDNSVLHLGTAVSKNVGTVYQALTDGLVTVTLTSAGSTAGAYVIGYTDSSNPPTTGMGQCSVNYPSGGESDLKGQYSGFEMRVKAGDYYKATQTTNSGSATATMYFTPWQ